MSPDPAGKPDLFKRRVVAATGATLGLERLRQDRAITGLRTLSLVGLASCIAVLAINVRRSAVITVQELGASLSLPIGAWIARLLGYRLAIFFLGSLVLGPLALWIGFAGTLRAVCDGTREARSA